MRDHKEWIKPNFSNTRYIQFKVTDDLCGIEWDGNEKFYNPVEAVNTIIINMQDKFPEFGLSGTLEAFGECASDVWLLVVQDGVAHNFDAALTKKELRK